MLQWQARSNPLAWWWGSLTLVSAANILVWFMLYREFYPTPAGSISGGSDIGLMLLLCAGYVFGCAFRSFLPRADVQRICLFDTWLSSVFVGRTVATVAELCFAAQWAIILHQLGTMTGAETVVNIAWVIVPHHHHRGVLLLVRGGDHQLPLQRDRELAVGGDILPRRASALCRLLPEFQGPVRLGADCRASSASPASWPSSSPSTCRCISAAGGPGHAEGSRLLGFLEGLHDVSTRWVVTHDIAHWKGELTWMFLYFSAAVWSSLALCALYAMEGYLTRYLA